MKAVSGSKHSQALHIFPVPALAVVPQLEALDVMGDPGVFLEPPIRFSGK